MLKRFLLVILAMAGLARADERAHAVPDFTGSDLIRDCEGSADWQQLACMRFSQGVAGGINAGAVADRNKLPKACFPASGVTNLRDFEILKAYLRKHPEHRHAQAQLLAYAAFAEAYPCPKE
jgi:hypothetical protein